MLFNIIKGNFCPDDIQNLKKRIDPELFIPPQILIWTTLFHLQYWIFCRAIIFSLSKRLLETKRSTECDCYCVFGHTNPFVRTFFLNLRGLLTKTRIEFAVGYEKIHLGRHDGCWVLASCVFRCGSVSQRSWKTEDEYFVSVGLWPFPGKLVCV